MADQTNLAADKSTRVWRNSQIYSLNAVLAGYGASIKSVGHGHKSAENIIQSILTGDSRGPNHYPDLSQDIIFSKTESELLEMAESTLLEVNSLTKLAPSPVPIAEFCVRPENIAFQGICK